MIPCRFLAIGFLLGHPLAAQSVSVNGFVEDASTGERLGYATVYEPALEQGFVANEAGFFRLMLPKGSREVIVSHVGYQPAMHVLKLVRDTTVVFSLLARSDTLGGIEIAELAIPAISSLNQELLTPRQIEDIPVIMGEPDVLKALQLLPGVQSGAEGSAGLYVRGGGPDQNMILLDGAPIYHAAHVFGFFSVFNTDAVQSVRLVKGGFPARYGGRLSSVVEIDTREGNLQKPAVRGGVGLVASRVTVEAPLAKDKSAFMISGRRTYLDYLFKRSLKDGSSDLGYFFYDLNAKFNYVISSRTRLVVAGYTGKDRYFDAVRETFVDTDPVFTDYRSEGLSWRNTSTTARLTHIAGSNVFLSAMAIYSRYRLLAHREEGYVEGPSENIAGIRYRSGIEDFSAKIDVDISPHTNHSLRTGLSLTHHTFDPGAGSRRSGTEPYVSLSSLDRIAAVEGGIYVEDELRAFTDWRVNIGFRASGFRVEGRSYTSIQPRVAARYLLGNASELTASFTRMRQYIHLLAPSGFGMPTDLWLPSTRRIRPGSAVQFTLGYTTRLGSIGLSIEGFYKSMDGLLEYLEGASFSSAHRDWQDKVAQGEGHSRGLEVLVRKNAGKTTGLLGYTWANTNRKFDRLNEGKVFPYRYDRRHDVSALVVHQLSDRKSISATWVYGTGDAITAPTGWYIGPSGNRAYSYYPSRGNYRAPAYHRLDIAYTVKYELKSGESALSFNIYNAYNRKNPFYLYAESELYIEPRAPNPEEPEISQTSLLPIVPSISYSFSF